MATFSDTPDRVLTDLLAVLRREAVDSLASAEPTSRGSSDGPL